MDMEHQDGTFESALTEKQGIEQPPTVSSDAVRRFLESKKKTLTADEYVQAILRGDRTLLSKAITLIESHLPEHQVLAKEIVEKCLPHSGKSLRIGITGVPGVGKSTFIESFGKLVTGNGEKLAVLAIDPSSERTKGSILGDKTRMEQLSVDPDAYIRPSPSAGSLGGVAQKTRESMILCEAAGFTVIFIETVGVGQSETAVHSMVDFFLLLMLAGAGDELQGIKRGIMEMADSIVITKADSGNGNKASLARIQYANALHLFPPTPSGWVPEVLCCSSVERTGLPEIWATMQKYVQKAQEANYFYARRHEQSQYWMHQTINEALKEHFYADNARKTRIAQLDALLYQGKISSFAAADELLNGYFGNGQK
jgi:LAO/AO transport system kinase